MRSFSVYSIFVLAILLLVPHVWGEDTRVTASVDSDAVGVQDQLQLTITVSGNNSGDAEDPRLSNLQGFKIVSGPNVSTQFQWINGRSGSSKSFMYVLIPEREGQFAIGPVDVRVGDKTYKTQPLQIRVTSAPSRPAPQPQRRFDPFDPFEEAAQSPDLSGDAVFVKEELDRNSAYAGQQLTLLYKLYTQVRITGIELQESPPLTGFWVEDLEVGKNPKGTVEVVDGKEYQAYVIKKQALFATATGMLKIPSTVFAISAAKSGDFFGVFGRAETLYRKTQELSLNIKPLPAAGRPSDFSNAVGNFKLTAATDKARAATGEAIAFNVKLEGRGNLKMIPDISVPSLPGFTVFSSKRADTNKTYPDNQIGGEKVWQYVLVPKAAGRQTIHPISFSFFNPDEEKYETTATSALTLDVVRGDEGTSTVSGLSGIGKQDLIRQGTDVNFIKLYQGDLERSSAPFYPGFWFYLVAAAPLAFNAGAFFYQRQRARSAENQGFVRSRRAKRIALERLKEAEKTDKTDARHFYDSAAAAFSGYLADRLGLTEIEMTGDTLERMLSDKEMSKEIVEAVRQCLQDCDFGRFVSASDSGERMSELSSRIRKTIDAMEKATAQTNSRRSGEPRFNL